MSIYSGFSTRQTEDVYNRVLLKMLQLLHNQVLYYLGYAEDTKPNEDFTPFSRSFSRLYNKMKDIEERKYLPPKFSSVLEKLSDKVSLVQYGVGATSIEAPKKAPFANDIRLRPL
jgi:hypothetical protein